MTERVQEVYRGWSITIEAKERLCSNFSFSITGPSGKTQSVTMGGDNEQRALERAREMVDLEINFAAKG